MTVTNFDDESNLLDIDRDQETSKRLPRRALILIILVLTASASFGLGILAAQSVHSGQESSGAGGSTLSVGSGAAAAQIIGDSSTHQFYLPWCSQAASISEANQVQFASEQAAEDKGYSAGKDCAGL